MKYQLPINRTLDLTNGRRVDVPLSRIPIYYRGKPLAGFADFENGAYSFELDQLISGMMENNLITASLAYETWHQADPSSANCRIVAVLIEDKL
jgi:hypothetical protein